MSDRNQNVFYEVGYAHAKRKLCILLTGNANDIPFDLKHRRHIVYGNSIAKLKTDLAKDLRTVKDEIRRLNSGGWAQVKVLGKKTLAYATKGEKLETSYNVSGLILVRVVAAGKVLDFPTRIDINCDEVPF